MLRIEVLRTEHIRGGERWGPPHSLPLQYRASTALAGWGHVPSPVPPQRAEATRGGRSTRPPPLAVVTASIVGVAAAQPAASAKSSVENGGGRRESEPRGPWSEVVGRPGGAEHTSPPLAVVTGEHRRHRGGPAGREREEQRVGRRRRRECEPGPPGPWSAVVGPRAGRRARARRRRRAQPWRGEDDRTRGERGEGDQGS